MLIRFVAAALLACAALAHAQIQSYPAKPIRVVVPFAPGGGADIIARILGQKMTDSWGQQVVVENRAGASGNIGAEIVSKTAPDGYTLLLTSSALAINPSVYRSVPYDLNRDFAPITQPGLLPNILVVHPSLPVKTVKDLIALARSHPASLHTRRPAPVPARISLRSCSSSRLESIWCTFRIKAAAR